MQKGFEATYHSVEANHWWFISRRALVKEMVLRAQPNREAAILEIGCSGGLLLEDLQECDYTKLTGIDISEDAVKLCRERKLGDMRVMDAQRPEFPPGSFDVIIASDILEHLSDAPLSLRAWHKLLRPEGVLIIFVPAFMFLWSDHDVVNQHFHRYQAGEMVELLKSSGFDVRQKGYWNFTLFPPVMIVRLAKRLLFLKRGVSPSGDLKELPRWLNSLLTSLLFLENRLITSGINFPWGVSVIALAKKHSGA